MVINEAPRWGWGEWKSFPDEHRMPLNSAIARIRATRIEWEGERIRLLEGSREEVWKATVDWGWHPVFRDYAAAKLQYEQTIRDLIIYILLDDHCLGLMLKRLLRLGFGVFIPHECHLSHWETIDLGIEHFDNNRCKIKYRSEYVEMRDHLLHAAELQDIHIMKMRK